MDKERSLLRNGVITPDGTRLLSLHRHDYRTHKDSVTGETYMVDGGLSYIRRNLNKIPAEEINLYEDEPHEKLRMEVRWGTYGKDGDDPLRYVRVCDMSNAHVCNRTKEYNSRIY